MGLFDFFRKDKENSRDTVRSPEGPAYLEGFVERITDAGDIKPFEWRGRLKSSSGGAKFYIKYYGGIKDFSGNLIITGTDFAPQLLIAIDAISAEEIILFDGCRHGYNGMFSGLFSNDQRTSRKPDITFSDRWGASTFEIIISAYYQGDFDREVASEADEKGMLELEDGRKIDCATARRDSFDVLLISGINESGKSTEIINEELS